MQEIESQLLPWLGEQTWEQFEAAQEGKKLFIFGAGEGIGIFLQRYQDKLPLYGVADNNRGKQGHFLGDFVAETVDTAYASVPVCAPSGLYSCPAGEIVVLIVSKNYYAQIAGQLREMGINDFFVLKLMEDNRKKYDTRTTDGAYEQEERKRYAEKCAACAIEEKKVVCFSFGAYADHGRYITESLLNERKDLDLIWLVDDLAVEVPEGVRLVYAGNWKRFIYEMETAHIWIFNMVIPSYLIKRRGQIYIQTKHWASVTLKKFYLDAETLLKDPEDVENWRKNGRMMDYIITGSDFDTKSCRRGFDFHKDVLQIGSPRTDAMFHEEKYKKKIYRYYHLEESSRMLLYAPTYRYKKDVQARVAETRNIDMDYDRVKAALEKRFGGMWNILLRLHPGQENEVKKLNYPRYVIDASRYPDGQELAAACDVMISDYSSIMFEPAFVKKPVFLYAADKKEYIDKEYDLLMDYDTLPFAIAESNEELAKNIELFERERYEGALQNFMERYGIREDGHASERAAGFISKLIK